METNKTPLQQMVDNNLKHSGDMLALMNRSAANIFERQLKLVSDYASISNTYFKQVSQAVWPFNFFVNPFSVTTEKKETKDNPVVDLIPDLHELAADQFARIEKEWPKLTREFQKLMQARLTLINTAVESTIDAYNKQLDLSKENGKHIAEELNRQFFEVSKQYNSFWLEFFALMGADHTFAVKPATSERQERKPSEDLILKQ